MISTVMFATIISIVISIMIFIFFRL